MEPSVPLRRTTKTTVFYTKPKEASKDTDEDKTSVESPVQELSGSASDAVVPQTQMPSGDNTVPPEINSDVSSSLDSEGVVAQPVAAPSEALGEEDSQQGAPVVPPPTSSAAVSEQQQAPTDENTSTSSDSLSAQGVGVQTGDQKEAKPSQRSQHVPPQPVKVPSRVTRPWEQIPKSAQQPGRVSEGADSVYTEVI